MTRLQYQIWLATVEHRARRDLSRQLKGRIVQLQAQENPKNPKKHEARLRALTAERDWLCGGGLGRGEQWSAWDRRHLHLLASCLRGTPYAACEAKRRPHTRLPCVDTLCRMLQQWGPWSGVFGRQPGMRPPEVEGLYRDALLAWLEGKVVEPMPKRVRVRLRPTAPEAESTTPDPDYGL